ncbi:MULTISPECIES: hypothetical protein [Spirosoma]|uniref:YceK/YidQ family lipoprotein n=1 Tax=Spirosoma liriopis TaxID=2937440 RepID=A0ABT0HS13_9BACT|nr:MULTISPECIES: hypothetical protein [Spirosoma]MCK8494970.1 hypothetical protein [Spirosoma liriopis]UHG94128.1 hypothetical protein LQ777_25670 [Spirosoma oryzicola]
MIHKTIKSLLIQGCLLVCSVATLTSCATVFGGPRTSYQVTKPRDGEPQREVRVGALIADIILFWPGTIVDFATGAIYRPAPLKPPYITPSTTPPTELR